MGGKPSRGTRKDMRLKANRGASKAQPRTPQMPMRSPHQPKRGNC